MVEWKPRFEWKPLVEWKPRFEWKPLAEWKMSEQLADINIIFNFIQFAWNSGNVEA